MNLNLSASLNIFKLIARPSLCLPHQTVSTFNDLPIPLNKALEAQGRRADIRAVVLDKDDCFAVPETNHVYKSYEASLLARFEELKAAYPGRRLLIVSNTAGATTYDRNLVMAAELEKGTGLTVLPHSSKKPGCGAEIMEYFKQHPETGVSHPSQVAIVGDRLSTDIMMANMMGSWGFWVKEGVVPNEEKSVKRIGKDRANREKSWPQLTEEMFTYMGDAARRSYTPLSLFEHYFLNIEQGRPSPNAHSFVREYRRIQEEADEAKREYDRANGLLAEDDEDDDRSGSNYEPSHAGDHEGNGARPLRTRLRRRPRNLFMDPAINDEQRGRVSIRDQRPLPSVNDTYRGQGHRGYYEPPNSRSHEVHQQPRSHSYGNGPPSYSPYGRSGGHDRGQSHSGYQDDYHGQQPFVYQEDTEQWRSGYGAPAPRSRDQTSGRYADDYRSSYQSRSYYEQSPRMPQGPAYYQEPTNDYELERPAYSQDDYEHTARERAHNPEYNHAPPREYAAPEHGSRQSNVSQDRPLQSIPSFPVGNDNHRPDHRVFELPSGMLDPRREYVGHVGNVQPSIGHRERSPSNASTVRLSGTYGARHGNHQVHQAAPVNNPGIGSEQTAGPMRAPDLPLRNAPATANGRTYNRQRELDREDPRTPEAQITRQPPGNVASNSSYGYAPALDLAHDHELPFTGPNRTANDHINAFNIQGDQALSERMSIARSQRGYPTANQSQLSTVGTSGPVFSSRQQFEPYRSGHQNAVKSESSGDRLNTQDNLGLLAHMALMENERPPADNDFDNFSAHGRRPEENSFLDEVARQHIQENEDDVEEARRARIEKGRRLDAEINADIRRQRKRDARQGH
ncbi:hypothetical protein ACHAQH_006731 [Verticillium albo-atrum]